MTKMIDRNCTKKEDKRREEKRFVQFVVAPPVALWFHIHVKLDASGKTKGDCGVSSELDVSVAGHSFPE